MAALMDDLREKLGAAIAKVDAAHKRLDKHEQYVREDVVTLMAKDLGYLDE